MSSPLKVAIVGTGIFATDTHLPTIKQIPAIVPSVCYNRTKSKAEDFAKKADISQENVLDNLEDVFKSDKVDFVDALLPVQHNLSAVKLAVENNKPLCFEKPIAANLDQAKEIVKLSKESKLPIMVLENWAYINNIKAIKEIIPKIGEVVSFTHNATGPFDDSNKYLQTSWRLNPEHVGGYLSDGGVHQLALLVEVLGEVDTISAQTRQLRKTSGDQDILFSTMKLKSGVIGSFTYGSTFGATDKSTSFKIYGTAGSITYDWSPALGGPIISYQTGETSKTASDKTTIKSDLNDTIKAEFENFAEAVKANDKSLIVSTPEKAFHHLAIIVAALESSRDGKVVTVASP